MRSNEHLIGQIVPAGTVNPRWLFVTKVDGDMVYGRRWSARAKRWTKTADSYSRDALYKLTPRCPKPRRPAEMSEWVGNTLLECRVDGGWYVFSGSRTGEHRLWRDATSKERLAAHWAGYVAVARRGA